MTATELNKRYQNIPQELKSLKRWVGYKVETLASGKQTKRPYNALSGMLARVNDSITWSTFNLALSGCEKFNFDGIGFVLGNGIFGVDLDNHADENTPEEDVAEFKRLANEFVATLNSYTEWSQSGKGIHIICKGKLPEGSRRKGCVEMYDENRFFAFTGNAIRNIPLQDRQEEIKPLWEKYVYTPIATPQPQYNRANNGLYETLKLSDQQILENVANSRQSEVFFRYYDNGDISLQGGDASKADMAFCSMLAFWCNKDVVQMDRIFRNSGLMRPKWDEHRGAKTYGQITLDVACRNVGETYVKKELIDRVNIGKKTVVIETTATPDESEEGKTNKTEINYIPSLDDDGEPIFRIRKVYGSYPYSDTGNALKFYDYFGDLFKYNVTDKVFMFWTGKTWVKDYKNVVRKYANKLIEIMKEDDQAMADKIEVLSAQGRVDESKRLAKILDASQKNTARVANKAGKDAMLSEFQTLKDIPVTNDIFDKYDYLLNTESGIVDLRTGAISPFDKTKLLSKNTHTKVSFERSEVWEKFLWSIFDNGNIADTQEIIDSLQTCIGYSLTGSTEEQCMFLLYGDGSNGKSTLVETISNVIGDYGTSMDSKLLVTQKGQTNSPAEYAIAKLQKVRFVTTGETDEGGRLSEAQTKILTGSDPVNARFPYGNPFTFIPNFKIWMSSNYLLNIRGKDYGIWRRIFLFIFCNIFTEEQKDKSLPSKLRMEADKILGWCIKGFLMYQEHKGLIKSKQTLTATADFKKKNDQVLQFIDEKCIVDSHSSIECTELYEAYKVWAQNNTDFVKKESQFSTELTAKDGIRRERNGVKAWCYYGIRLNGVNIRRKE